MRIEELVNINTCPISCCIVETIKNNDEIISIEIKDINEEFEKVTKLKSSYMMGKNLINFIEYNRLDINIYKIEKECKLKGRFTLYEYIEEFDNYCEIKVCHIKDNLYSIWFNFTPVDKNLHSKYRKEKYKRDYYSDILENIAKLTSETMYVKDLEGKYIMCNKAFEINNNVKNEDIIGKTVKEVYEDEEFIKEMEDSDKEVISTKKKKVMETIVPLANSNTRVYFEITKLPILNRRGNLKGTIGLGKDISLKKIEEEKNKIDKEDITDIYKNISDMLCIFENNKIKYISPNCKTLLGITPKEVYDDIYSIGKYIHPEDIEKLARAINDNTTGQIFRTIIDNQVKWLWVRVSTILDEKGKLIKRIAITSDITEQKRLDEELERLRMEFFANISHEFRTPLNLIFGSIQLLRSKEVLDDKFIERYLNIITQNSYRLLKLVDNLIDSTKIGTGYFDYNPKNYNLIYYIEEITQSIVEFANQNNIEVVFDTNQEELIMAFDLNHMERIILNILSNAIKFCNKEKGRIEININVTDEFTYISIKDNGMGIEEKSLEEIFEMFRQGKNRITKEGEGSGIGLHLVKSLVNMQGGKIYANSKVNEGSEFVIELPNKTIELSKDEELFNDKVNADMKAERMKVEFSDIYSKSYIYES